jgi:hypothetical protein
MGFLSEWFNRLPRVEVFPEVKQKQVTNKKTGELMMLRWQDGYLYKVDDRGREIATAIQIGVPRDGAPSAPGMFVIDGASFKAGDFGDLMLDRFALRLLPIPAQISQLIEQDIKRAAA